MKTKNLGAVTAYADAVKQGYTGTREEFGKVMANFADTAKQVETDAQEVRETKENIAGMETNVRELQNQASESANVAEQSKTEAAGHASAAEASRQAAAESEANANARVNGFDEHVANKTTEAEETITSAKQAATDAITAQQAESVQTIKDETTKFIADKQATAEKSIQDKATEYATNVNEDIAAIDLVGRNQVQAVTDAGETQVRDINAAGQTQTERVQKAGTDAVDAVNAAGADQTKAINDAGTVQTTNVNAAGAAQMEAIQNEGATQATNVQQAAAEIIADRDQIDINRQNILKSAIKSTASGTPIQLSDSADMPIVGLKEYAWTKQERTTEAQLFDVHRINGITTNGKTFDILPDGGVHVYGMATSQAYTSPIEIEVTPGTYYVSGSNLSRGVYFYVSVRPKDDSMKQNGLF